MVLWSHIIYMYRFKLFRASTAHFPYIFLKGKQGQLFHDWSHFFDDNWKQGRCYQLKVNGERSNHTM